MWAWVATLLRKLTSRTVDGYGAKMMRQPSWTAKQLVTTCWLWRRCHSHRWIFALIALCSAYRQTFLKHQNIIFSRSGKNNSAFVRYFCHTPPSPISVHSISVTTRDFFSFSAIKATRIDFSFASNYEISYGFFHFQFGMHVRICISLCHRSQVIRVVRPNRNQTSYHAVV